MILLVTQSLIETANKIVSILEDRNIQCFRFNTDMFQKYCFCWKDKNFQIEDPIKRIIQSKDISATVFYKAQLVINDQVSFESDFEDSEWIKSYINTILCNLAVDSIKCGKLKLWNAIEFYYPKIFQMQKATRYFTVPHYCLQWGTKTKHKNVIVKPLNSKPYRGHEFLYAKKVDQALLDFRYPWFIQEIAKGNRDATVVYINGHVHCYQFATERGDLTDWRVTQGTERNKWEKWDAGTEFEEKIDAYMKEMGLKFGRLDFIIGGKEPQFLEVNPCGQFGWLDDEKLTLHNEVVDAILAPSSTIEL